LAFGSQTITIHGSTPIATSIATTTTDMDITIMDIMVTEAVLMPTLTEPEMEGLEIQP
jgi:hypothetical protein